MSSETRKVAWRSGLLTVALAMLALLSACTEDIDTSARYVFKERTIISYLEEHDKYSEYLRLLKEQPLSKYSSSTVYQLLTAYGYYTCFAPTNQAIQLYLDSMVRKGIIPEASWDRFPDEQTRDSVRNVVVMNSIIDGTKLEKQYFTSEFPAANEEFSISTMADRKLSVTYPKKSDPDSCLIDGISSVSKTNRDIETINGIVHEVAYVINPSDETLGTTLRKYAKDPESGLSVMAQLVDACGLTDTLTKIKDEAYDLLYQTGAFPGYSWHYRTGKLIEAPEHRRYGFTLFAVGDEYWEEALGKSRQDITPADVQDWVKQQGHYTDAIESTDYSDANNLLNQFVTYHLLSQRLPVEKIVIHSNEKGYNYTLRSCNPTIPVWAHYVTMGKRRLLRAWESAESNGVYLNRFPELNNERSGNYHEKSCAPENVGQKIYKDDETKVIKLVNSMIYIIDEPLFYSEHVRNQLGKTRLRYDVWEFQDEAMNNDLRFMVEEVDGLRKFSSEPDEQYFDGITVNSRETIFLILDGIKQNWPNYQCDELLAEGVYDITVRLPPVPKQGVYELRMGVSTESSTRGICQVYFGSSKDYLKPAGIPVNMALGGDDPLLGWEQDTDDDDYNAELDIKMRNNDFMKGPEYIVEVPGSSETNRRSKKSTRRILLKETMSPDVVYYMRFKTVQDSNEKQLFVDYLEWCPKEVYDNPETPEDIW